MHFRYFVSLVACLFLAIQVEIVHSQTVVPPIDSKTETLTGEPTSGILTTIFTENVSPRTTRGILIDGGSGGSRLHIYAWAPRVFRTVPPPISFPTTNEQYTAKMGLLGGVQNCWKPGLTKRQLRARVMNHFRPMIDFAKSQLTGLDDRIPHIPIWFKATGGAREMTPSSREELLDAIRDLFEDKSFNPFMFKREMARVISGEEEAVFSWACMNFLKGNLIPASQGMGQVTKAHANGSFGTLDLGGSSTQIAFFLPSEDYMEGLYKLQIGGQKHWNVYTKSFLQFGINSARRRMFRLLATNAVAAIAFAHDNHDTKTLAEYNYYEKEHHSDKGGATSMDTHVIVSGIPVLPDGSHYLSIRNPCFHQGWAENVTNTVLDESNPAGSTVNMTVRGPILQEFGKNVQLNLCLQQLKPLMEKDANAYCNVVYHGECSIGGAYQPALPTGNYRHFYATSTYQLPWTFLRLPENVTLEFFAERAGEVCAMTLAQTADYVEQYGLAQKDEKLGVLNQYFCFMASYTLVLLQDGYGFKPQDTITAVDKVNGFTTGWALGAMIHEINNLPWELEDLGERSPWGRYILSALIGIVIGAAVAFSISSELNMNGGETGFTETKGAGTTSGWNNKVRSASSSSPSSAKSQGLQMGAVNAAGDGDNSQTEGGSWKRRISQLNPFSNSRPGYETIPSDI